MEYSPYSVQTVEKPGQGKKRKPKAPKGYRGDTEEIPH
jgi:hypothetical protein